MGFYVWIDEPTEGTNVMAENTFAADSQRENGFQSGQVASSIRMNTALRQSTLVTAALMNAMGLDNFDYTADETTLRSQIETILQGTTVIANPAQAGVMNLTRIKIGGTIYNIPSGTSVTANPTLSGSEASLTGLQVGSTKYANHKSVPKVITMTGTITHTGDVITLGEAITNCDYVDITLGYLSGSNTYQIASIGFSPANTVYAQNVAIPAFQSNAMSSLTVSILGTTMACVSNAANVTWLPVKCIGYKFS